MRILWILMVIGLGACGMPLVDESAHPDPNPSTSGRFGQYFLRLETGGHTAAIGSISVDRNGRFLVTGSNDKTARVWRLTDGRLEQILRPPIGEGHEGKIFAIAISPDGGLVAVGGVMGAIIQTVHLYIFDRASGRLLRAISELPDVITNLAFSQEGRYLAAAFGEANGVRVYRTDNFQEVFRDLDYGDTSYSVDFDTSGRLITTSFDGFVRLYGNHFQLLAKQKAPGGEYPYRARFSPDGGKIAVGFVGRAVVNVLSDEDLTLLYTPNTPTAYNGSLITVAWSADGRKLYAAGSYADNAGWCPVIVWSNGGQGRAETIRLSTNTVTDLRVPADGRLAYSAIDPVFGVLNSVGRKFWDHGPDILDLRGWPEELRVSSDGNRVEFGFKRFILDGERQKHRVYFDLAHRELRFDESSLAGLTPPNIAGEPLSDWQNTFAPKVHGQSLNLNRYEISTSLALSPKKPGFLLGTEWWLRYYESLEQLRWHVPVPGASFAVNLSERYAIAAYGDGTIRWYKLENGQEVLALFVHSDLKRWIIWTPEGFYDAGPGSEGLIGYHLNQGQDREGLFVAAEQMEGLFYRPDLIAGRLSPEGDQRIVEAVASLGDVGKVLAQGLPPELELVSTHLDGFDLVLEFRVRPRNGGLGRIDYKVNGVAQEARFLGISAPGSTVPFKVNLPLPAGQKSTVEIAAFNGRNSIASQPITLTQSTPEATVKPTLYVLAVGVSEYRDQSMNLHYAAADAQAIAEVLTRRGEDLFQIAAPKVLVDEQADLDGIRRAFKELAPKVGENDVFLFYLAGHGVVFDGAYHFIPQDAVYRNEKAFRAASLDEQGFRDLLKTIRAQKSLILLDTCYAGALKLASFASNLAVRGDLSEKTAITKLMRATGRTVLMASSDQEMALEGYRNHGFFTFALLEGLEGKADSNQDREISTLELADYAYNLVPEITGQRQFPIHESSGNPFPIGYRR